MRAQGIFQVLRGRNECSVGLIVFGLFLEGTAENEIWAPALTQLVDRLLGQLPFHKGVVGEPAVPVPPELQAIFVNSNSLVGAA